MPRASGPPPGRRQYLELKRQHPDALLLVRMGDFFEAFDDDARVLARVLDIALTARDVGNGVRAPLAGIPHQSIDSYLPRLVGSGLKIAIAEQTSDPAESRGIVDRAVVRILTPGTVLEPGLLDERRNNYLAAAVADDHTAGFACADITTGEFLVCELPARDLPDELARVAPAEVLADRRAEELLKGEDAPGRVLRRLDDRPRDARRAAEQLEKHFRVTSLEAYGCEDKPLAVVAAATVLDYLTETQRGELPQITGISTLSPGDHMGLDRRAVRDLEVFEPQGGRAGTPALLLTIDRTRTAMGGRMLRGWLARPLQRLGPLRSRQAAVRWLCENSPARLAVRDALGQVPDLERLINRVRTFAASPRELNALARGLAQGPAVRAALAHGSTGAASAAGPAVATSGFPGLAAGSIHEHDAVVGLVRAAIEDDPSTAVGEGHAVRPGFDPELDEVRSLAADARSNIAAIEEDARARTGVRSLKVGYNRVFGYYIEVSKANLASVPADFERRQTLVNAERFVTPALKDYESRVLNARERLSELERSVFRRVCTGVVAHAEAVLETARALGEVDALAGLADRAVAGGWTQPELDEGDAISIRAGRHPVVEAALGPGRFVPNDTELSSTGAQLAVITGPNMSGKSTYIRQVAVIVLLAQIGSHVPADSARVGLVDRVFTRCGSMDEIARGRSTFLVEMEETAAILNQATRRSLVILDEIGRGTSTYDGLAIARAVAEHIHSSPRLGCKTLFATHYHEMTSLAEYLPRAVNYQVAVAEENGEVVFLHRILPGGADRSYGVHVGRLAGLPHPVINRAWELLAQLEGQPGRGKGADEGRRPRIAESVQLPMLQPGWAIVERLAELDVSTVTPMQAINLLYELQRDAKGEG
jgi:DNA mismatch repair protein MutS